MAALLAAEADSPLRAQRLQHVAVADRGGRAPRCRRRASRGGSRGCSSPWRRRCRRASAPRSCSASAQMARIWSPSTTLAVGGRRPGSGRRRRRGRCRGRRRARATACDQRPEVGGADAVVDVPAVGLAADRVHAWRRPGGRPRARRRRRRRARSRRRRAARRSGWSTRAEQVRDVVARRRRGRSRTRPTPAPVGRWSSSAAGDDAARSRPRASSGSLCPPRLNSLMPLSGIGLWLAEIMTPRSAP